MLERLGNSEPSDLLLPSPIELSEVQRGITSIHDMHSLSQSSPREPSDHESSTSTSLRQSATAKVSPKGSHWYRIWWLEIATLVLSLVCLAANVGILLALDGRKLQDWKLANVEVTPNTLVSILATISKSALLLPIAEGISQLKWPYFQRGAHRVLDFEIFEDAARGPLGSMVLVWTMHLRVSDSRVL